MSALLQRKPPAPVQIVTLAQKAALLISVMDRLTEVIGSELEAVRCSAHARVKSLQSAKQDLYGRLDEVGRLLRLDRAGLAALPLELLARLGESSRKLHVLTAASLELLDTQVEAQKCVVDVVVKTVNHERRTEAAYGRMRSGFVPQTAPLPRGRSSTYSATL